MSLTCLVDRKQGEDAPSNPTLAAKLKNKSQLRSKEDSAREIREYYIPDFSQWERPEKFKEEFEKLVRDLKKAEAEAEAK